MPKNSRRNRRNIPVKRKISSGSQLGISPHEERTIDDSLTQVTSQTDANTKSSITPDMSTSYIAKEVKWIVLTTAIVAVLLAIAYIFLK